jgi:FHS family L-fucose permease-like MFS transporter
MGRPAAIVLHQVYVLTSWPFLLQRIASTPLLKFFPAPLVLIGYGCMTSVFSLVAAVTGGKAGIAALFLVFWGESVIYPTTFTLATSNLGRHTKRGAGLLVRCFSR